MKPCQANELEALIAATPDGGVCHLENKRYDIKRRVEIRDRRDLTIEGNGALIVTEYINSADYTHSTDAFLIERCQNLVLRNVVIDTDVSPNVTATVEKVDAEAETLFVRVDEQFPMKGNEVLMTLGSVDDEDSFDYRLHHYALHPDRNIVTLIQDEILLANTYASAPYDYLGDNCFAIKLAAAKLAKTQVGDRVCIRHTMYGPGVIILRNSDDTVLENITMYATPGMGLMILPRCHNLTVDGLRMIRREGSSVLMSCNCDGIHMTGLSGKFIMRNSEFDGLGDDALNIHSTAGTASEVDMEAHTIRCHYCKKRPDGELPATWCRAGDRIRIFDPKTIQCVGELTVVDFREGVLTFSDLKGQLEQGFSMQNMAFTPSCLLENCTVKNTRCRAFLFQTNDVEVRNCTFFGMSSCAIKAAPDLGYWYEVGPVDGLYIHDNRFVKNGFRDAVSPTIALCATHKGIEKTEAYGLHKNVRIENNTFERSQGAYIEIHSADGVILKNNQFLDRRPEDSIHLWNCRDVQ